MSEPLIELQGVTVGYEDKTILEKIDLRIEQGEIVCLLGGSGSGKSTLLRAMTGLQPPLSGTVKMFGEDFYAGSEDDRRRLLRRTGMAFQQDALFGAMSIGDNVSLPLRELTKMPTPVVNEMTRIKLGLVGLSGFERRAPASLSGGQRKRAALARASIMDPELIFCDEPSAGLDPVVAAGIDDTLRLFRDALGVTIVVVTHELASIHAIADRAIMLAEGGIRAVGTVDELEHSKDELVHNFFNRIPLHPQAPQHARTS